MKTSLLPILEMQQRNLTSQIAEVEELLAGTENNFYRNKLLNNLKDSIQEELSLIQTSIDEINVANVKRLEQRYKKNDLLNKAS